MSFKTSLYSACTVIFTLICGAIGKLSKYKKEIFNRCTLRSKSRPSGGVGSKHKGDHSEPGHASGCHPEAGTGGKAHQDGVELAKPGSRKKSRRSPNVDKGSQRLSSRRKLEAALPFILQAIELDNAGSLEAVGAYKKAVKLFDDAIEILNNKRKPRRMGIEVHLEILRDTYRDRADLLLLEFRERVLNRKF
ncbi:unnamed protein product [Rhizoctonia solani]|uniref:MIT domain-containing protein n=1 Tax=Rhizoctonia solani TaxID=456999 RepID=A0A8H3DP49_9AGAM|nr:unnamed protein product [Rhizoctonia solani]